MPLSTIADLLARPPAEVTRRDIAIAALQVPAEQGIEEIPVLRRRLTKAGNPLTEPFWQSLESTWLGWGQAPRPGAPDLAGYILTSPDLGGAFDDPEEARQVLEFGFSTVVDLWMVIEAVDSSHRLTDLGWWGLPEALRRTWSS